MKTLYLLALQPATIGPNATLHWCHRAFCGGPNTFTFGQRDRASSVGIRRRLDFLGHHPCALGATARSTCGDFEEAHRNNALNFKAELDGFEPWIPVDHLSTLGSSRASSKQRSLNCGSLRTHGA